MSTDLLFTPATELCRRLASRSLSSAELVEALLRRIEEVNPRLNAIVALRAEEALAEARRADAAEPVGPLHGLPVTVKELNETLELPTTYGSRAFAGWYSGFEALVVTRLKQAGAIVVGKTNSPELGLRPTTENLLFGRTENPWASGRTAGGSTGGGAAAVAAGISPLTLGGDGGGSCRIPASCCGVVGLKPSRGRVPWAPSDYEFWAGLATHGPIARTVGDVALMLSVIGGPVVGEPYGVSTPPPRRAARLRLALMPAPAGPAVDDEVTDVVLAAARVFEELGHAVVEIDRGLGGLAGAFRTIVEGNTAALVDAYVPDARLGDLEASTLALAARGWRTSAADYCAAVTTARNESAGIVTALADYDYLLTPTLTRVPPRHEELPSADDHETRWRNYLEWLAFTYPFNLTGQPAISVPAGWTREGLPVGLQIVGASGDDEGVVALAAAFETAQPWIDRRPPLAEEVVEIGGDRSA